MVQCVNNIRGRGRDRDGAPSGRRRAAGHHPAVTVQCEYLKCKVVLVILLSGWRTASAKRVHGCAVVRLTGDGGRRTALAGRWSTVSSGLGGSQRPVARGPCPLAWRLSEYLLAARRVGGSAAPVLTLLRTVDNRSGLCKKCRCRDHSHLCSLSPAGGAGAGASDLRLPAERIKQQSRWITSVKVLSTNPDPRWHWSLRIGESRH